GLPDNQKSELVNFVLWMHREGFSPSSIRSIRKSVVRLSRECGGLMDSDRIKEFVASLKVRGRTKLTTFKNYSTYARYKGFKFSIPKVPDTEPAIPFIP